MISHIRCEPTDMFVILVMLTAISVASCHTLDDVLGPFGDVCTKCKYTDGCCYVPYPNQCGKFVQCLKHTRTYFVKSCPVGLHWDTVSETCNFPCAARCAWGHDSCQMKWSEILRTDSSGRVVSGNKKDLQTSVENGARIKIGSSTYRAEIDNCQKVNGDVCCQSLMHISKANWEQFQSNSYWWMINVCTTGNWHMVRYYVGGGYLSETRTKAGFSWYVLRKKDGSHSHPVYSAQANGSATYGNINALIQAVEQGEPVSIVSEHTSVFPIQSIEVTKASSLDSKMVSAQHVWSVSQTKVGNHIEYQKNAYWWFLVLTTSGSRDMSRWNLGSHTSRGHTRDTVAMDWFVDECWTEVHSTGSNGLKESTLKDLRDLVEAGHSVRVKLDDIVMEADSVRISHDHVSVQLVSALARADATSFAENLNWEFRVLGTTGPVRKYSPLVGSPTSSTDNPTVKTMNLTWFVDTKKWHMLFHIANNGSIVSGSALAVRHAAEEGADIRVGYKLPGDLGFRYSKADNIGFGPTPDIAVQLVRLLRDHPVGNDEFKLDDIPQWSFRIVSTKGFVRTTQWIVGQHVNRGRTTERAEVMWFVNF